MGYARSPDFLLPGKPITDSNGKGRKQKRALETVTTLSLPLPRCPLPSLKHLTLSPGTWDLTRQSQSEKIRKTSLARWGWGCHFLGVAGPIGQ